LLIRWLQFGTFNPVLRIHGFGSNTELWRYGGRVEAAARRMLGLRYRLLPYLYSAAWQCTASGGAIMRPMLMDFPDDPCALAADHQFLFGDSILVAPVTRPGATSLRVYLPAGTDWYDFWTGYRHPGGSSITVETPLEKIPLFVRAGGIIPLGPFLQHTGEKPGAPLELRIYPGSDGAFTLYDDAGDGYAYENGERTTIALAWNDAGKTISIGTRQGSYPGMPCQRTFRLVIVGPGHGTGSEETSGSEITFDGPAMLRIIRG
jgi:alpha-D-xyloside xylohydrolase